MLNKSIKEIIFLGLLFSFSLRIAAQEGEIDTSAYLPYFYYGALDYNLMIAASNGYESEVARLIDAGADIDAKTTEGATPLIFAVANNHLNTVKKLLGYDPDVNVVTATSETPLLIAVKNQNVEIAEALIRAGADIDFSDKNGAAPLHYSSLYGFFYVTDMLIYYRADIEKKARDGTTPLMAAIWGGNADIADLLIQHGANMAARDNQGFTPFHIAAQNGDTVIMAMLIRQGVDIYEVNRYNWDALALTIRTDNMPALKLLLRSGTKWGSPESKAIDPYTIASKYRRTDIIDILRTKNVPGKVKKKIDQAGISVSSKLNMKDIYTGFSLSFKEPLMNAGIIAGLDTKVWYTRVLQKRNEDLFYQYLGKSSVFYAGAFKEFPLIDNKLKNSLSFSTTMALGYSFGNQMKGTDNVPGNRLTIMPSAGFKWNINNVTILVSAEYMKSDFYRVGPLWLRAGLTYNYFFDRIRAPLKNIKWY
jgi:ankyrin repeat protein